MVDVVQRRGDLQDHVVEGVPAMPVEVLGDPPSGKELHREIWKAVVEQPEVEDLDDAGVGERGEGGELALEAEKLLRLGELVPQDLDGLVALVGDVENAVNAGGGRLLQDRSDLISGREL